MKIAQTLSFILGLVLGIIAIKWLISPEDSANSLNMVFLEGLGRNTQIRDFTAMFMGTSAMCFFSLVSKQYQWIFSVGLIYSIVAITSIYASFFHDAPIATSSLIAEIIFAVMAFISAFIYKFK
ncbi:hypothetical protein N9A69_01310 [Gammaproteobacteria bacterium]|nr:hypothetical protein [Gammaproteobacteria bacterium]MDA7844204.1 hypothetical protein [Gammaproteobacteria bacterium]